MLKEPGSCYPPLLLWLQIISSGNEMGIWVIEILWCLQKLKDAQESQGSCSSNQVNCGTLMLPRFTCLPLIEWAVTQAGSFNRSGQLTDVSDR